MGRSFLLLTLVVLSSGCGVLLDFDPADVQDGGATDIGTTALDAGVTDAGASDAPSIDAFRPDGGPAACRLDTQCDDHVFCNGAERCVMGACITSAPPTCPGGAASCVVGACDGVTDSCVLRAVDSRCAAGQICDRMDGCRAPPTCTTDAGCVHDACHTATCASGMCVLTPIPPCDDANPSDCLVAFCHPVLGCTTARSTSLCDDGAGCTTDVCNTDGSCSHLGDDTLCDFDGASCTFDACAPTDACADPTTGCTSRPDDAVCAMWLATIGFVDPAPACFTSACMPGSSADPTTGCVVLPQCTAPGSTCVATASTPLDAGVATVCGPTLTRACSTSAACDDGNPCNGLEMCGGMICHGGAPPCGTTTGTICTVNPSTGFSCAVPLTACAGP